MMRTTLFGKIAGPVVALAGVFDPFLPRHQILARKVADSARQRGLTSMAVVLHPNPAALMHGPLAFTLYDDFYVRVWRLHNCGVDAVLRLHMTKTNLDSGAAQFFDAILTTATVAEFWLGNRQSLGPGLSGSVGTVSQLCGLHGVKLKVLPRPPLHDSSTAYEAQRALADGRLEDAIKRVGRPPVWSRPRSNVLKLPWPPGRYWFAPVDDPGAPIVSHAAPVVLEPYKSLGASFEWPDRTVSYAAFLASSGAGVRAVRGAMTATSDALPAAAGSGSQPCNS
jgi:hypothetical protein